MGTGPCVVYGTDALDGDSIMIVRDEAIFVLSVIMMAVGAAMWVLA